MLPSWKIENMRRRVERARRKGDMLVTCPSSRHLHMIADYLSSKDLKTRQIGTDDIRADPEHVAQSIYAVIEALWKERSKNYQSDRN